MLITLIGNNDADKALFVEILNCRGKFRVLSSSKVRESNGSRSETRYELERLIEVAERDVEDIFYIK